MSTRESSAIGGTLTVAVLQVVLALLRLRERELSRADLRVQLVLGLVHLGGARVRLGPEVARVGGIAAELETDQVVLLIVRQRARLAVLPHLLPLQVVRVVGRRADRPRPALAADR